MRPRPSCRGSSPPRPTTWPPSGRWPGSTAAAGTCRARWPATRTPSDSLPTTRTSNARCGISPGKSPPPSRRRPRRPSRIEVVVRWGPQPMSEGRGCWAPSSSGSPPSMSHAPIDALRRRHATLRTALAGQNLDALVVTSLPNILYLSNFAGSSAILIVTADRVEILTDFRYITAVGALQRENPDLMLTVVDGSYDATLVQRLSA